MQQFELGNLLKIKQQLQQKISAIDKLKNKISQINNKLTHQDYQKVNSVMMRKVQIKHTSEFIIKLNDEYFAQVKSHTALQNLQRKRTNYQQQLKKVTSKIELLQKKIKKTENKKKDNDFLDKYDKSTVEVIGTNQEGDSVFNIIEVEGEEDSDLSEWKNNKKTNQSKKDNGKRQQKQSLKKEQINKQTQDKKTVQLNIDRSQQQKHRNQQQKLLQEQTGYKVEGDEDILFDEGDGEQSEENQLSDIDENQEEEENLQKVKIQTKKHTDNTIKPKQTKQSQKPISSHQTMNKNTQKASQQITNKNIQTQTKERKVEQKNIKSQKPQTKIKKQVQTEKKAPAVQQPQPAKPISKFKLERMKQKLQQNL